MVPPTHNSGRMVPVQEDSDTRDDTELLRTLVADVSEIRRWVRFVGFLIITGLVLAAIAAICLLVMLVLAFSRFNLMGS